MEGQAGDVDHLPPFITTRRVAQGISNIVRVGRWKQVTFIDWALDFQVGIKAEAEVAAVVISWAVLGGTRMGGMGGMGEMDCICISNSESRMHRFEPLVVMGVKATGFHAQQASRFTFPAKRTGEHTGCCHPRLKRPSLSKISQYGHEAG